MCTLSATQIRWCGRLILSKGVHYGPRGLQCLLTIKPPATETKLQQFVCALQWVQEAIRRFKELIMPLHDIIGRMYGLRNNRAKLAVSRIVLSSHGWGKTELYAFDACKKHWPTG